MCRFVKFESYVVQQAWDLRGLSFPWREAGGFEMPQAADVSRGYASHFTHVPRNHGSIFRERHCKLVMNKLPATNWEPRPKHSWFLSIRNGKSCHLSVVIQHLSSDGFRAAIYSLVNTLVGHVLILSGLR